MSTVADAPRQSASVRLRHRTAFWVAAFALLVMLAFSAVPTPLYPAYQARDGFSSFMITVIFATYPVGVVISLFTVGHLSDWHGRRSLVLPALGGSIVSAFIFIFWRDVPGLLLARFVAGLAVGAVTASATAWIAELHAEARPDAAPRFAEVVATAANLGGIGCGPLISGMLVAWVADPFVVPFLVFIAALLVAAALVLISPETRAPVRPRPAWRPQRISVPADARGSYLAAAITAAISFASFALFTSLAPTFLADTLHHTSPALAGATAFIVFASGAAGQLFVSRRPIPVGLAIGTGLMLSGLAIVVLAVWLPDPSLALFLIGGALAGAGSGCLFKAVLTQAARMALTERRAETLAGMFLAGYVGLALPVVGLGVLTQYASAKVGLLVFGAALATAALATAALAAMPAVLRGARRFA